jgi:hypothetical protein
VKRRPPGPDRFLFRVGTDRTIQGAIPAVGVQWFSFELKSIEVPGDTFTEVGLGDGSFAMSRQTIEVMRFNVPLTLSAGRMWVAWKKAQAIS